MVWLLFAMFGGMFAVSHVKSQELGFTGETLANFASCCIALFHGSSATILSLRLFLQPDLTFFGKNTRAGLNIFRVALAFFVSEFIYMAFELPDPTYLVHHFVSLMVMMPFGFLGHGQMMVS